MINAIQDTHNLGTTQLVSTVKALMDVLNVRAMTSEIQMMMFSALLVPQDFI